MKPLGSELSFLELTDLLHYLAALFLMLQEPAGSSTYKTQVQYPGLPDLGQKLQDILMHENLAYRHYLH